MATRGALLKARIPLLAIFRVASEDTLTIAKIPLPATKTQKADCDPLVSVGFFLSLCYTISMEQMTTLQNELKNYALSLGADIVGFCSFDTPPSPYAPNLCHALSIGVKLSDTVLKTIDDAPSFVYFQHYRTANALLDQIAFRLARKIEEYGFSALPIAASQSLGKDNPYRGALPHKTVAVKSGLGFVGKSGLFLSEKFGGKVRLATVLTDLPVQSELPVIENGCG